VLNNPKAGQCKEGVGEGGPAQGGSRPSKVLGNGVCSVWRGVPPVSVL